MTEFIQTSKQMPSYDLLVWRERIEMDLIKLLVQIITSVFGLLFTFGYLAYKTYTDYAENGAPIDFYLVLSLEVFFCVLSLISGWLYKRSLIERDYVNSILKQKLDYEKSIGNSVSKKIPVSV